MSPRFELIEVPDCPDCGASGLLVGGGAVYPHRPDLAGEYFWACLVCRTWVGCHPGTKRPLGRMANAESRRLKREAHEAFDPLWRGGGMTRSAAYAWLARSLGRREAHMGDLPDDDLRRVVELSRAEQLRRDFQ